MTAPKSRVLFVGCGDIAQRTALKLGFKKYHCTGLRRNIAKLVDGIEPMAVDLDQEFTLAPLIDKGFDFVVITLTPNGRDPEDYSRCYVENMKKILAALTEAVTPIRRVLFVSSTSVYGQNSGEWVDEESTTKPTRFNGRAVLKAEQLLSASSLPYCILRFSGIYGPGRNRLINQAQQHQWSESDAITWSNRIHADDGAGFIAYLLKQVVQRKEIDQLYLVTDSEPVRLYEVKRWLAEEIKAKFPEYSLKVEGFQGKRCKNTKMLSAGYVLKNKNFRDGYAELLPEVFDTDNSKR